MKLDEMRQTISAKGLDHLIKMTGRLDKAEMPRVLSASDACLVHLSKVDLFEHVIPSKIFETMAMRRPIIMGVRGRARDIVLSAKCGVAMEPENDEQLCEIVEQMSADPDGTRAMGERGREFVTKHFHRDELAADLLEVVERTAAGETFRLSDRTWEQDAKSGDPLPIELDPVASGDRLG